MKNFKLILIFIIVVLLGVVIIQNTQAVQTKILLITIEMPLILLLLLTATLGFALGLLIALYRNIKDKS